MLPSSESSSRYDPAHVSDSPDGAYLSVCHYTCYVAHFCGPSSLFVGVTSLVLGQLPFPFVLHAGDARKKWCSSGSGFLSRRSVDSRIPPRSPLSQVSFTRTTFRWEVNSFPSPLSPGRSLRSLPRLKRRSPCKHTKWTFSLRYDAIHPSRFLHTNRSYSYSLV